MDTHKPIGEGDLPSLPTGLSSQGALVPGRGGVAMGKEWQPTSADGPDSHAQGVTSLHICNSLLFLSSTFLFENFQTYS